MLDRALITLQRLLSVPQRRPIYLPLRIRSPAYKGLPHASIIPRFSFLFFVLIAVITHQVPFTHTTVFLVSLLLTIAAAARS